MNAMLEVRMLLAMAVAITCASVAYSQGCPKITVTSSTDRFVQGQPAMFAAFIEGGPGRVSPKVIWTLSAGTIISGDETKNITVDTTGIQVPLTVKATFTSHAARGCIMSAEATLRPTRPARKADEYSALTSVAEVKRLRPYVAALNSEPWATAYIISYGGRTSDKSAAEKGLERVEAELVKQGIPAKMIATFDGGYKEKPTIELWIVPTGAPMPQASPTVDPSEVKPQSAASKKPPTKKRT